MVVALCLLGILVADIGLLINFGENTKFVEIDVLVVNIIECCNRLCLYDVWFLEML